MHEYDARELRRLSGAGASAIRTLARAGHIHPVKRAGRLRYSFHDLVIVRTAKALRGAHVPARNVHLTLATLRSALPAGASLSGISVTVLGDHVAVRDGRTVFEPESGQYALQLDVVRTEGELRVLETRKPTPHPAAACFARAMALEESDAEGAIAAYRDCLAVEAEHLEACINLGRLLHALGRLHDAEAVYRRATAADSLLAFNRAVLLEDQGRAAEAAEHYRTALALDPNLADAHFNLARLHETAGRATETFRHLLAYRRLASLEGP